MSRMRATLLLVCVAAVACKTLEVVVPAGAKPGEILKVPHGDKILEVRIPEGSKPGGKLFIDADVVAKAPAKPLTTTLNVTVPPNAKPGHVLYIEYKGRKLQVTVPKGVAPGSFFEAVVHLKEEDTEIKEENGVLVLHRGNFDTALRTYPFLMVDFYAPWCGACKKLAPDWDAAAKKLEEIQAELDQPVKMAKFDSSTAENEPVADAYGVEAYPTLKIFRQGQAFPYRGEWDAQGLVDEIRAQASPALILVDSEEALKSLQRRRKLVLLGMFNETTHEELMGPFSGAAEQLREVAAFGVITKPAVLAGLGLPLGQFVENPNDLFPSVIMLRYYDMEIFPYVPESQKAYNTPEIAPESANKSDSASSKKFSVTQDNVGVIEMTKFVNANILPTVMHLTSEQEHENSLSKEMQKEVRKMKRAVDKAKRMKEEAPQMNQLLIQSRREDPWMTDLFMRDLGDKRGDLLKIKLVAVLSNSSQLKPIMPQMTKMAETSDGEVACAYFVASDYPQLRNLLNIGGNDERDLPALVAINIPDGDKFVVPFEKVKLRKEPEIMSFDAIDRFISDVRSDLIKPTIKSEEPPKDRKANRAKAIVTITGRTFLDDVVDAPQEIILKLYAPWCGNCKSFAPVFNRTSRLFAKEDRISFAEMDLSQNELPKHLQSMVSSYPTLLYFHGDNPKNVTSLEGPLTMEAVAEHVLSNTRLNKTTYPEYQGSGCKFDAPLYQKMTVPLGAFDQVVSDTRGSVNWYLDAVVSVWNENAVLLELPVGRTGVLKDAVVSAGLKVDANGIAGLTSQSLVVVYVGALAVLCAVLFGWVGSGADAGKKPKTSVTKAALRIIRAKMVQVYTKQNLPENVKNVDEIMKTWKGKEHMILDALRQKYGESGMGFDDEEKVKDTRGNADIDEVSSENEYEMIENKEQSVGEATAESPRAKEGKKDK